MTISAHSLAHVKWLTKHDGSAHGQMFGYFELFAGGSILLLCIAVAKVLNDQGRKFGMIFSARISDTLTPLRAADYLVAIYFLGCALSGYILAPHVRGGSAIIYVCVALQVLASVLLLVNRYCRVIAALMLILFVIAGLSDPYFFVEYLLLAGLAWVIYTNKKRPDYFLMLVLRWSLGLSLVALGLTEKLLQPELAVNVLNQYPLNFMQAIGIDFSDRLFVMAAGMVELLLGLLLILGLLVRTTTIVLLGLMIISNLYFFWVGNYPLAVLELIGHLPVFAVGILLLLYSGEVRAARIVNERLLRENFSALESGKKYSVD